MRGSCRGRIRFGVRMNRFKLGDPKQKTGRLSWPLRRSTPSRDNFHTCSANHDGALAMLRTDRPSPQSVAQITLSATSTGRSIDRGCQDGRRMPGLGGKTYPLTSPIFGYRIKARSPSDAGSSSVLPVLLCAMDRPGSPSDARRTRSAYSEHGTQNNFESAVNL